MPLRMEKASMQPSPGKFWNKEEKRLWVASLFFSCSMIYATRSVMPVCAATISDQMNWDKTQTGTVLSSFFWGYTLTQVLGGYLSDRIGGSTVLMLAATGWSLTTFWTPALLHFYSDSDSALFVLTLTRTLLGCFQGVHFPSISSIMSQKVAVEERGINFATATSGSHLGTLLCGALGSILMDRYGWEVVFYVIGLLAMVWLLFLRYYVVARERSKALVLSMKENMSGQAVTNAGPVPWLQLFRQPAFWSILVGHMCHTNSFFILLSWLPTYFHENFPDAKGWVYNVVPWLLTIPSAIAGGWFADYLIAKGFSITFVRKILETLSLIGTAIFLLILCLVDQYGSALFCMTMAVMCCGLHNSGILINPQDIAPKYAGSVFGLMNTAGAIPGFVGVYMAGHILHATGRWGAVFSQTAVICVIGWIGFVLFGTGKPIV